MINRSETGLEIFDNFSIDRELPKYKIKEKPNGALQGGFGQIGANDNSIAFNDWQETNSVPVIGISNDMASMLIQRDNRNNMLIYPNKNGWVDQKKDSMWLRFKIMWRFLMSKDFKREVPPVKLTIQEYFRSIKMSCQELQKLDNRMEGYTTAVKHAEDFGQKALAEDLKSRIEVIKLESRMYAMGITKVITEEQVVEFTKDTEKGLQLIWIRNFDRIIPASLLSIKKRADELEIFDNYVVLSYDPQKKSYKQTKEEYERQKAADEAKRRDPILFGVLENSRKLYYLGSWVDEFCDLTLDKFIEKFGEDAITKNDINVNKY